MNTLFLLPLGKLCGALLIGLVFGFLLKKAGVTDSRVILAQLSLKDFTVMKIILTAIATGSLLLFFFKEPLSIRPNLNATTLGAALAGGAIFGVGMAIVGYCPGTCIGALARRDKQAFFGFLGMLAGAFLYAEIFPFIRHLKPEKAINLQTLDLFFQIPAGIIIAALLSLAGAWFLFDLKKLKSGQNQKEKN
ncbi:MAG: YeeE/YedE thiosulfate transporter family protein [Parachlamydiales bacterium]|jgi:hypothetical protein